MTFDDKDKDDKGAPEQAATVTVEDDDAAPIEIDIGDGGDDDGASAAEPEKPKKGPGRLQRKINQERALRGQAETTAQRLARENEELRQRLSQTETRAVQADRAALTNYEEATKQKLDAAKRALVEAQNSGDASKIADATAELGKHSAEVGRIENWRRAHPDAEPDDDGEPEADQPRQRQQSQRQAQQQEMPAEVKQFLADNPWFVPGTKENPNPEFDIEMHQFAVHQAKILEMRYARQGKQPDADFWKQIEDAVRAEFGDDEDEAPKPAPRRAAPRMGGDEREAPVRAGAGNPAVPARQNGGTKVTLTGEERAMARQLADQGAYRKPDGSRLTHQEAEVRFAKALHRDRQQQAQLPQNRRA